jgi:monovalent cation:H+ antiporter-2, CPA2 family
MLSPLRDLFAAVFFVFFGLSTDPRQIPGVLLAALVLGVVTVGTKMFGGWWAARRNGIGSAGRLRAGPALNPRGEFSITSPGWPAASPAPKTFPPSPPPTCWSWPSAGPLAAQAADLHRRGAPAAA